MPSGYKEIQGPNSALKLRFDWQETSVNNTNNTSSVSWTLKVLSDGISSSQNKSWQVTINGVKYSGTHSISGTNTTIASGETTITHGTTGSKTFTYSFSCALKITWNGTYVSSLSGSGSGILTNIPRQSSIGSINGNTLGSLITVNIVRHSASYTHKIEYSFEGGAYSVISSSAGTSASFTPPISLSSKIPRATSGSMTIRLTTYSGSTKIGALVTKKITVKVPTSVVPQINSINVSQATTAYQEQFGAYIQGKSKAKVSINASGSNGSTIKSYQTTMENTNYTGQSITTNEITKSGNITITCKVTDTRGRIATKSTTISVLGYSPPKISTFTVIRTNSDGSINATGLYAKVTYKSTITSLNNKNTIKSTISYKANDASTSTILLSDTSSYILNSSKVVSSVDEAKAYTFTFIVKDYFTSTTYTAQIGSAFFALTWMTDGKKGIGIGKVSEREGIDFSVSPMVEGKPMIFFANSEKL